MNVIQGIENWRMIPNPVVTVGSFDGVHLAHKSIVELLNRSAALIQGQSLLITFNPHPRQVLHSDDAYASRFRLLSTWEEKARLLEKARLQNLLFLKFDEAFSRIPYDRFIEDILVERIGVKKMVVGFNHNFGKDRIGGFDQMRQYGQRFGFEAECFPEQLVHHQHLSSTKIRTLLNEGLVKEANELLGYDYGLHGYFREGGFEVDNPWKLVPAPGNYLVRVRLGKEYDFTICRIQDRIGFPDLSIPVSPEKVKVDFIKQVQV